MTQGHTDVPGVREVLVPTWPHGAVHSSQPVPQLCLPQAQGKARRCR